MLAATPGVLAQLDQLLADADENLSVMLGALADIARREGTASAMLTMIETVCADATTCPSACGHDMFAAAVWRLHSQRSAT